MKRILMLAAAGAAIAAAVTIARRRRHMHAIELAGPDVIIDEVVVHFELADEPTGRWAR